MGKTATAILFSLLLIGIAAAADFTINTTAGFDNGTKSGTATITDEYNHTDNVLEMSFPYVKKDANLVAFWRFEGNATDLKGVYNGTALNTVYNATGGKFGGAYYYNGVNASISHNTITGTNGVLPYSLSVWIKPNSVTGNHTVIDSNSWWGNAVYSNGTNLVFVRYPGSFKTATAGGAIGGGSWYYVTATYNANTTMQIYINGVQQGNNTSATMSYLINMMGKRQDNGDYFDGTIDEYKIYNKTLHQVEITALYNSGNRYVSSGDWISATQPMPPVGTVHLNDTTITYSGATATNYISKIEWRVGGVVNATYATAITSGTSITIEEANLTSGTFNNVTSNFTIRVYFTGGGAGTPMITSISGNYVTTAVTRTWNASANGNWTDANNWSPVGIPAEGESVVFNATSVKDCTVDAATSKIFDLNITSGYTGTIAFSNNISVARHATIAGGAGFAMAGPYGLGFFGPGNVSSNVTLPLVTTEAGAIVTHASNLTITNLAVKANSNLVLTTGKRINVTNETTLTGNLTCSGAVAILNTTLINGGTTALIATSNVSLGKFTMTAGTMTFVAGFTFIINGDFNQTGGAISGSWVTGTFKFLGENWEKTGGTLAGYIVSFGRNGTMNMRSALSIGTYVAVDRGTTLNTNGYAFTSAGSLQMGLYGTSGVALLNCSNSAVDIGTQGSSLWRVGSFFNGGTGNHRIVATAFVINSGANYTATSGTTTLASVSYSWYWTNQAGTVFDANNGTFAWTSASNYNFTMTLAAGQTLANLRINATPPSSGPSNWFATNANFTGTVTINGAKMFTNMTNQSFGSLVLSGVNATFSTNRLATRVNSVTMSAGLLNASNSVLSVSGTWNVTGGTLDATNSTALFNSGATNYLRSNGLAFDSLNITDSTSLYAQDAFNFTRLSVVNGSAYNVTVNGTTVSALTSTNVTFYP